MDRVQATTTGRVRKRKAENQDNERLSKRLSLLNLERNGQKLYVPVEQPSPPSSSTSNHVSKSGKGKAPDNDLMQVDDTKHKVYIYDLDAELSDSESSSDEAKLIFLPDISKHLRETRIPPVVLASPEGELAGMNKQMVLYNVPSSLSVPEEKDSVRKAIIETRARARARRDADLGREAQMETGTRVGTGEKRLDARDWYQGMMNGTAMINDPVSLGEVSNTNGMMAEQVIEDDDPDAMDLG